MIVDRLQQAKKQHKGLLKESCRHVDLYDENTSVPKPCICTMSLGNDATSIYSKGSYVISKRHRQYTKTKNHKEKK